MLDHLNWELSILSRAVAFSNLSSASAQIGVSQPQLSRIVAKIEAELSITLLDREAKRKSAWTIEAHRLAEIYAGLLSRFRAEIHQLNERAEPTAVHIGTLEGMVECALKVCEVLYTNPSVSLIELIVSDLDALEERYFKGNLDFLFTSRTPGRKKHARSKVIGYQSLSLCGTKDGMRVLSSFEYATQMTTLKRNPEKKVFVSNSMKVRDQWIQKRGGIGLVPSAIYGKARGKEEELPVLLIGNDLLPEKFWVQASKVK